jgi:hypothetical protein
VTATGLASATEAPSSARNALIFSEVYCKPSNLSSGVPLGGSTSPCMTFKVEPSNLHEPDLHGKIKKRNNKGENASIS